MTTLPYRAFDADNHYYEALDAFTRHLDPRLGPRTVQWAEINGRRYHVVGGRVSRAVVNPTFNPVAKAGALHAYFRGNPDGRSPLDFLRDREPIRPEYRDRDARLRVLDEHGLEAVWLFPTLGMLYEELLKRDPDAVTITFTAFNRWLEEDWGFAYQQRIFAAPYLSLADVDWAVRELEWALARGARVICIRPAAAWTASGPCSPADARFDPFWARVAEAGVTVVAHAGDSGYSAEGYAREGFGASFDEFMGPNVKLFHIERAIHDFLATLSFDKLYERHPGLRIASVENGSEFLGDLFRKLRSVSKKYVGWFGDDPVELFRRHVWVNPFWEDDVREVVSYMGADRVIFGSDWPHIEGMPSARLRGGARGLRRGGAAAHPARQCARADGAGDRIAGPALGAIARRPTIRIQAPFARTPEHDGAANRPRPHWGRAHGDGLERRRHWSGTEYRATSAGGGRLRGRCRGPQSGPPPAATRAEPGLLK